MKRDNVVIVFNPKGGTASRTALQKLELAVRTHMKAEVHLLGTDRNPDVTRSTLQLILPDLENPLVIAVGGDGTARVVAEALMGTDIPMSVFPGGTGNLFARTYYNYPSADDFAKMLANGLPQSIDMLEIEYMPEGSNTVEHRHVLVTLGFGKLSDAISDANPNLKRWFGSLAYAAGMFRASFDPAENMVSFTDSLGQSLGEGFEQVPVSAAFIMNVAPPHLINVSRGATASDKAADVVVFYANGIWRVAQAAFWVARGKPERSRLYARRRLSDFVVTSSEPMSLNIDGDGGGRTNKLLVRTLPAAVRMVLA